MKNVTLWSNFLKFWITVQIHVLEMKKKRKKDVPSFHFHAFWMTIYKWAYMWQNKQFGFWPGLTQTDLYSHRRKLESWNFVYTYSRNCTIHVAKTKALISFAITVKLNCVFAFAKAKIRISHDAAQIVFIWSNIQVMLLSLFYSKKFPLHPIHNHSGYSLCFATS